MAVGNASAVPAEYTPTDGRRGRPAVTYRDLPSHTVAAEYYTYVTIAEADLLAAVRHAHALGLKVLLTPHVDPLAVTWPFHGRYMAVTWPLHGRYRCCSSPTSTL